MTIEAIRPETKVSKINKESTSLSKNSILITVKVNAKAKKNKKYFKSLINSIFSGKAIHKSKSCVKVTLDKI